MGGTPPVCISASLPQCLGERGGSTHASPTTSLPPCLDALANPQWVSVLRSTRDTAQQKVLRFPLTALPRAGGSSAITCAIAGEEQKAPSQALHGDGNNSGATGSTQRCPSLVCCWPGALLHAVSAQISSERQPRESKLWVHPVLLRLAAWPGKQVWLQRRKTRMLIMSIPGVYRSWIMMLSVAALVLLGFYSAFHRIMAVSPSIFWELPSFPQTN